MIYVWRKDPHCGPVLVKKYGSHHCWYILSGAKKTKCRQGYKEKEPDSNAWGTLTKDEQYRVNVLSEKIRDRLTKS